MTKTAEAYDASTTSRVPSPDARVVGQLGKIRVENWVTEVNPNPYLRMNNNTKIATKSPSTPTA